MARSDREWLMPLTGLAFIVIAIVSFAIAGEPPTVSDDSAREITDWYVDNKDSVQVGSALSIVALTLFVFFGGYLRKILRATEGEDSALPLIAFVGTLVMAIGGAVDTTINFTLAETADDISPAAVQSLSALWENDFFPFVLGLQLLFIATGLAVVRHGALPKWLGWVAIVLGVVAATPAGFVAFMGGGVWVLIVSILLAVRARGPGARPETPPPAPGTPATA